MTDNILQPDEYNPRGYFEFEPVKKTKVDAAWLTGAEGKAVKMVYLLLRDLPSSCSYRVIMIRRDVGKSHSQSAHHAAAVRSCRRGRH